METKDQNHLRKFLKLERATATIIDDGVTAIRKVWKTPNGCLHRDFGPAIEWKHGGKEWYQDGKLHRETGPAVDFEDYKQYWIDGVKLSLAKFERRMKKGRK